MRWVFLGSFVGSLIAWGYAWYHFFFVWDLFDAATEPNYSFPFLMMTVGTVTGYIYAKKNGLTGIWWKTAASIFGGWAAGYAVTLVAAVVLEPILG